MEKQYVVILDGNVIAQGFQFIEDAQWWCEQYKKHHPEINDLKIEEKHLDN